MTLVKPDETPDQPDPRQEELPVYPPAIQSFGDLPSIEEFFHSLVLMDEEGKAVPEADGSYRIVIPDADALERFSNLTRDYGTLLRARENLTTIIQHLDQLAPFIMAQTGMESGAVIDFDKLGTFLAKCVFLKLEQVNVQLQEEAQETESAEVGEASPENVVPFGAQS